MWRDDAQAAYTMIHEDMSGRELRGIDPIAVPALALRGLTAAPRVGFSRAGSPAQLTEHAYGTIDAN